MKYVLNDCLLVIQINRAHCRTRVVIEQVNGQLKGKFRCLNGQGVPLRPDRAMKVITACCVLHNMSKQMNEPEDNYMDIDEDQPVIEQEDNNAAGLATRQNIIQNYFARVH